jgi:transposase, IS6 family
VSPASEGDEQKYRVEETYIKVKGQEKYLYRAVGSTGQTIDFLLTAKRDAAAAKRFFRRVFRSYCNPIPRVINVDKNPAYPAAIRALKREGILPRRVRLRQLKYLNNIIEQDHRAVKKRTWLAKGYGSFQSTDNAVVSVPAPRLDSASFSSTHPLPLPYYDRSDTLTYPARHLLRPLMRLQSYKDEQNCTD